MIDPNITDRVFYSWQSDCPNSTNRGLISTALERAVKEIKHDNTISVEPVVDRDTLGLPGSPDITSSIFEKIEEASAFVCDISIIDLNVNKPSPNPNVLLELGYAIRVLGWDRIILVMNTAFGEPHILPFDLRGRRVCTYSVQEKEQEKSSARNKLNKSLVDALKLIFESPQKERGDEKNKNITHDVNIFQTSKDILSEIDLTNFFEQLLSDHSYYSNDDIKLNRYADYFSLPENSFIDKEIESASTKLANSIKNILAWMSLNFFVYPRNQTNENIRFCMHPHFNIDREGHGDPEDSTKYNQKTEELKTMSNDVKTYYENYRSLIKNKLFV